MPVMNRPFVALAFGSLVAVAACSDDPTTTAIDAAVTTIDAAVIVDAAPLVQTCANYCALETANCTTTNSQYNTMADCMATCTRFPMGTAADMSGNTLGCRIYHADKSATDAALHCRHSGPAGDGVCGGNCENFCAQVLAECATQVNPPYNTIAACMVACPGFATTPPYSSTVTGGNSFACRMYHSTAAESNPNLHCPHTASTGGPCS
jgi:hypothetical protein